MKGAKGEVYFKTASGLTILGKQTILFKSNIIQFESNSIVFEKYQFQIPMAISSHCSKGRDHSIMLAILLSQCGPSPYAQSLGLYVKHLMCAILLGLVAINCWLVTHKIKYERNAIEAIGSSSFGTVMYS